MSTRVVLKCEDPSNSEDFNIEVSGSDNNILIYNNATDATAWYVSINIEEWNKIKAFIDQKIKE